MILPHTKSTTLSMERPHVGGPEGGSTLGSGLLGHWKMDESSGDRLDSSVNANHLIATGTVNQITGHIDNGAHCENPGALKTAAGFADGVTSFSYHGWHYWTAFTTAMRSPVSVLRNADVQYLFKLQDVAGNKPRVAFWWETTGAQLIAFTGTNTLSLNTWHSVGCGFDLATEQSWISVDGQRVYTSQTGKSLEGFQSSSQKMAFGVEGTTERECRVDDARFWNRTLTDSELTQLSNM
jgi:hypothetical protein